MANTCVTKVCRFDGKRLHVATVDDADYPYAEEWLTTFLDEGRAVKVIFG